MHVILRPDAARGPGGLTAGMTETSSHPAPGTAPASRARSYRTLSVLAVATGALWTVGVTLVATQAGSDPVGAGYDAANRALTLPLLLLVGYAAASADVTTWRQQQGFGGAGGGLDPAARRERPGVLDGAVQ